MKKTQLQKALPKKQQPKKETTLPKQQQAKKATVQKAQPKKTTLQKKAALQKAAPEKDELQNIGYREFVEEIKERVSQMQYQALSAVNQALITLYWGIGQLIVEKQEQHGWGKSIVENLSTDLQTDFPGSKGFSSQNLRYMRQFYLEYNKSPNLQPLVGEISWSKHLVIMGKSKDNLEREFYIKMTRKHGWSKVVLVHQIESKAYDRFFLNQTNFDQTLAEKEYKHQAKLAIKDSYSFDFLEMSENHSEREMELNLLKNIQKFLLEMGGDFAFIGNQYKLEVDGDAFYIDLLLYHRKLQ